MDDVLSDKIDRLSRDVDSGWTLINAFLIFFMQAGFSLLEAGGVRINNVGNILLKNLMCAALSTLGWFGLGYGLAYGKGQLSNPIFGVGNFFLLEDDASLFSHFVFHWALCSVSVTLCAGCVAERMNLTSYFCYNFVMSSVIYPIIAHSIWSEAGWLSPFNTKNYRLGTVGFMDYSGGTVVHLTGGMVGLIGTIILGPRIGRFRNGKPVRIYGHSTTLMLLGSWIIWFGFYGITSGSTSLSLRESELSSLAALNTTIAAATGALTTLFVHCIRNGRYDLAEGMNGALAGCVAITSCGGLIYPWVSIFIGSMAAVVYFFGCWTLEKLKIDDPLSTSSIHGLCGAAGTIIGNGLFSSRKYVSRFYKIPEGNLISYGLFLGGGWEQLGMQCLGVLITTIIAILSSLSMFFVLSKTLGMRVSREMEVRGLDLYEGGMVYPLRNPLEMYNHRRIKRKATSNSSHHSSELSHKKKSHSSENTQKIIENKVNNQNVDYSLVGQPIFRNQIFNPNQEIESQQKSFELLKSNLQENPLIPSESHQP